MSNIVIRIIIIALASVGVYKIFPQVSAPIDYYLKHPAFQTGIVKPAILTANKVLPEKLKIPTPSEVMGVATEGSASSPLKALTDEVSRQAADLAGEQINQLRKSASDAFCTTLIEKIKSECGLPQTP